MPLDRYVVGSDLGGRQLHARLAAPEGRLVAPLDSTDRSRVAGIGLAVPGRQTHAHPALRVGDSAGIFTADRMWAGA